jgi:transposase-like protein
MRTFKLNKITAILRRLTPPQRELVARELASLDAYPAVSQIIEARMDYRAPCPRCQSEHTVRHGHANGLQRYRCRECHRTFNALATTPLKGLHKRELWLRQAEALNDGRSLRRVAKELGIHLGTAHRWRHRFLTAPERVQPATLAGIAEVDETYFLLSFKGKRQGLDREPRKRGGHASKRGLSQEQVPVLVARDRSGATMDCVVETPNMETFAAVLKPFLPSDAVLCTDGSKTLAGVARRLGVEHHAVNVSAGIRKDGPWHIQNVNAYHSRLKGWIAKFRGVATCYLNNYLGWFRVIESRSNNAPTPAQWLAMALGERA